MPSTGPLVSVLVPTYNGAAYLAETLQSIHVQSYRRLEVIVRDDASTDDTLAIAADFAARDPRFRIVAEGPNVGGLQNYVELARLAKGSFVKYCNQDDLLDRECIATLLRPMVAHPRVVLSTSARRLIDPTGALLPPRSFTAPLATDAVVIKGKAAVNHVLQRMLNQIGEPSTALFRAGLVDPATMFTFGTYAFKVNCDLALWLTLLQRGDLYYHPHALSSFRQHDAQFSARPRAVLDGALEWVDFLEQGVGLDSFDPGAAVIVPAQHLINMLTHLRSTLTEAFAAEYTPVLTDAIERAESLTAGRVAVREPA